MAELFGDSPIRVVIVDDHLMLREGTQTLLERDGRIRVVGATGEGSAAIRMVAARQPDVLLLDLHLPDMSGVEVARQVRAAFPKVAVLVVTGYDDVRYVRALLQLGVRGYLRKTVSAAELVAAVRAVAEGRTILASEAVQAAVGNGTEQLTTREQEVLQLVIAGHRNAEIAAVLGISVSTVEFHVRNLLAKLGARSRTEAIHKAHQQGLQLTEVV